MGVTAWCLHTCPPLLIRSISQAYILDISKNYLEPLVKLIFVQSVKNPYSNSSASLLPNYYVKILKDDTIFIVMVTKLVTNVTSETRQVRTHM